MLFYSKASPSPALAFLSGVSIASTLWLAWGYGSLLEWTSASRWSTLAIKTLALEGPLHRDLLSPVALEIDDLELQFGPDFFQRSVSYAGPNHRLEKALRRARNGELLKVAILGGSVTAGANLPGLSHLDQSWTPLFNDFWNKTFPHPDWAPNVAGIGGAGSAYFENCALEHLPEAPDIIILENAVNDMRYQVVYDSMDGLLRSLLSLPNRPALVQLEMFSVESYRFVGGVGGDQLDVARYMDVPSVSLRNALLPHLIEHPDRIERWFGRVGNKVDPRHPGLRGHRAAAAILQHFFLSTLLKMEDEEASGRRAHIEAQRVLLSPSSTRTITNATTHMEALEFEYSPEEMSEWNADVSSHFDEVDFGGSDGDIVPAFSMADHFKTATKRPLANLRCDALINTRNKLAVGSTTPGDLVEDGRHQIGKGNGWFEWQSTPQKQYIISRSPGAIVTFNLPEIGAGVVKINYLASHVNNLEKARCWINDDTAKAVTLNAHWANAFTIGQTILISSIVPKGSGQLLHCELLSGEFRIISVISS